MPAFTFSIIDWIILMATLSQVLNFDLLNSDSNDSDSSSLTCIPPANSHLVITDTLESPATFYLIHSISNAINNDIPLLYISTDGNGIANLNSICNKSGIDLLSYSTFGKFKFIDALKFILDSHDDLPPSPSAAPTCLRSLRNSISSTLHSITEVDHSTSTRRGQSRAMVIVDDLVSITYNLPQYRDGNQQDRRDREMINWVRAVRATCQRYQASLITLLHSDSTPLSNSSTSTTDPILTTLCIELLRSMDSWIEIKGLNSGRAKECDGEICVHFGTKFNLYDEDTRQESKNSEARIDGDGVSNWRPQSICKTRKKSLLYRINLDGGNNRNKNGGGIGVKVWARGTDRGFV